MKKKETLDKSEEVDFSFWALGLVLNDLLIPYSIKEARSFLGEVEKMTSADILYLVREHYQTQATRKSVKVKHLNKYRKPLLLEWKSGGYALLRRVERDKVEIQEEKSKIREISLVEFEESYQGTVLLFKNKKPAHEEGFTGDFGFNWIFSSLFRQKRAFSNIMLAALCIQFFALVTPLFTMIIIDKVFSANGVSTLHVLIFGLMAMAVFDLSLGQARKKLLLHLTNKMDVLLLTKVFRHLSHLPVSFFYHKKTGDVVSRVKDIETVRNFITGQTLSVFIDFPFTIIFFIVMYMFNPLLTGITLLSTILFFVLFGVVSPSLKKNMQEKNEVQVDNQSFLYEMFSSAETLKSTSMEKQLQKKWSEMVASHSKHSSSTEDVQGTINQTAGFLNKATIGVCLLVGAMAVLDGTMTAGQLIAFNMLVGRVIGPVQKMSQMLQQLTQIKISMKRVAEIFNTPLEPAFRNFVSSLPTIKGEIEFSQVSYRYLDKYPLVLDNLSFKIKAGSRVGVIGPSGTGKTTLVKLMLRLLIPTVGKIKIDGMDTSQIDPVVLRDHFGVVQQDNTLFNLTIRENIAMARPEASMETIERVASLSGSDEFIRALPQGYDTVLGERGHMLSMGQRQRLAIARALITNPKILILDEATSFLDYESEFSLQSKMDEICKDRTVIIVSHRISSLRLVNHIISIEDGKVAENDTPQKLLASKEGRFYKLYSLQKFVLKGEVEQRKANQEKNVTKNVTKNVAKKGKKNRGSVV